MSPLDKLSSSLSDLPSTLRFHFVPHFVLRLSVEGSALTHTGARLGSARQDKLFGMVSRKLPVEGVVGWEFMQPV
jgi:hypothetical protein